MAREHIGYIDGLRLIAAAGVVYMHTAASGLRSGVNASWHGLNLLTSLAFSAVPLFFMISGYLLLTDEKTLDPAVLLRHRLPRLVIPLAGWTVVATMWDCVSARDISFVFWGQRLLNGLYGPVQVPYWFMYTLIAVYVLSPLLYGGVQALGRSGRRYLLALIALVSLRGLLLALLPDEADRYLGVDVLVKLQALGGYLLLFLLGWLLGTTERRFSTIGLIAAAVLTWAVICIGTWRLTVRSGSYNAAFQNQSAGPEVLLASCLFLLAKQTPARERPWLRSVVPLLFPTYLMHAVLLNMFYAVGIRPVRFVSVVGATVLNLVICYLTLKTVATVKPICYLATGMTYEKACASCNWVYTARRFREKYQTKTGGDT